MSSDGGRRDRMRRVLGDLRWVGIGTLVLHLDGLGIECHVHLVRTTICKV